MLSFHLSSCTLGHTHLFNVFNSILWAKCLNQIKPLWYMTYSWNKCHNSVWVTDAMQWHLSQVSYFYRLLWQLCNIYFISFSGCTHKTNACDRCYNVEYNKTNMATWLFALVNWNRGPAKYITVCSAQKSFTFSSKVFPYSEVMLIDSLSGTCSLTSLF